MMNHVAFIELTPSLCFHAEDCTCLSETSLSSAGKVNRLSRFTYDHMEISEVNLFCLLTSQVQNCVNETLKRPGWSEHASRVTSFLSCLSFTRDRPSATFTQTFVAKTFLGAEGGLF